MTSIALKCANSLIKKGLFLLINILSTTIVWSQQTYLQFNQISINQGLSNSIVQCILKDKRGFIWIGTRDGLNRFDGYDIKVYKNNSKDVYSIINEKINDLLEDRDGNLWVGTSKGLDRYDRSTDSFMHYPLDPFLSIVDILQSRNGEIWLCTNKGLILFDYKTKTFKRYQHDGKDSTTIITDDIFKVEEDDQGNLWIASSNGLDRFNRKTGIFTHFKHDPKNNRSIGSDYIRSLYKDNKGNIWIIARGAGLALYNKKDGAFMNFFHDPTDNNSLVHNDLLTVCDGPDGDLWIGTDKKGICKYNIKTNKFTSFKYDSRNKVIRCFYKDNVGNLWIGTHEAGILFVSQMSNQIRFYKSNAFNKNGLSSNLISSIIKDSSGDIWIGTDAGVNFIDSKNGNFTHYKHDPNNPNSLSNDDNYTIAEINKNTLAFGNYKGGFMLFNKKNKSFTHYPLTEVDKSRNQPLTVNRILKTKDGNICLASLMGLVVYNTENKSFKVYQHNSAYAYFYDLYQDQEGTLWVGGDDGLFIFDKQFNLVGNYLIEPVNNKNLHNNRIHCITEDKGGNIWVAGNVTGLSLFNKKTKTFTTYTEADGLPNNTIFGILEDANGNLWLSTPNGLGKFNTSTKKCIHYNLGEGDQGNEFKRGAYFKDLDGTMYFGSSNGVISFHPDSIQVNKHIPPVVLTDFQIFNKSVELGRNSPLKKSITEAKEILLSYKHSVFTFAFVALNYTHPDQNQYAYKLEPFDKDWNYVGVQRRATYTNLDPGTYIFKVKASNNDGIWNEEGATIKLIITPPFWRTWWFTTLCTLFIAGSAISFYRIRINAVKKQKEILEKEVQQRTLEVVRQKEEIKDSIRAAEAIQTAILPSKELLEKYLPQSFILYKPKDVVSGDFYWFDIKSDKIMIAAVDCTGHGVSGAFMSINGYHLLNKAIDSNVVPIASEILNRLNESIINELHQVNDDNQLGMDIALCILDMDKKNMQYAGANSPLYIVRNKEVIQVKSNKYNIGLFVNDRINTFTNHDIALQPGDTIYIFSDGYADQIGGPQGHTKFMYARFRDLLLYINDLEMNEQLYILDENFKSWKGIHEQLDDILIIGFRV